MPAPAANSLRKEERLSGKKGIDALLGKGKWGCDGAIKYCFCPNGNEFSRIITAVPKKLFKRAVKRNLLKRRMREAYRLQKSLLVVPCDIFFIYNSPEVRTFEDLFEDVKSVLTRISGESF